MYRERSTVFLSSTYELNLTIKLQEPISLSMNVICLEEAAFYELVEQVVNRLREKSAQKQDKWIDGDQTMRLLNIKSKASLQKLRDEGKIRFSQPQKKIILYDRDSIMAYLDKNSRETF